MLRGVSCVRLPDAVPWGTALLALRPMARRRLASTAARWALLRDFMQSGKAMESAGTSGEAVCLPMHLGVFYVFLLSPFNLYLAAAASWKGRALRELGLAPSPGGTLAQGFVL